MLRMIDRIDARIAGLIDYCSTKPTRALALIALLAAIISLPGLQSMPVTDRDEARFAQASKQMMETGDYIDIRNLDQPRWKKPVGIYWLQVASAKTFGSGAESGIWSYRLPSAIGIILAACLTWWALLPLISRSAALVAGLVVASTAATAVEAHIAKTDAVLLACTVLVFGALIRIFLERSGSLSRNNLFLWSGLGLGFLVKGPIILIPFCGVVLWVSIWERSLTFLRALLALKGVLLFALIAAPWYIAIAIKTDGAFFAESLGKDLLGKVNQSAEKHGGPLGYYLGTMWLTFWPWAPLVLFALPIAWTMRASKEIAFLAGWIIPFWVLFALLSTKLPHYILPVLPAVAALIGMSFDARPSRLVRTVAALLFCLGAAGASVFALLPRPYLEQEYPFALVTAGVLILIAILFGAAAVLTDRRHAFAGFGVLSLALMFPTLTMITAPNTETLFISPEMVEAHEEFQSCADRPIVSNGYREMSLAFLGGTNAEFVNLKEASEFIAHPDGGWRVFVRLDGSGETIPKLAELSGRQLDKLAVIEGTNYNSGKDVTIVLMASKGDQLLQNCRQ